MEEVLNCSSFSNHLFVRFPFVRKYLNTFPHLLQLFNQSYSMLLILWLCLYSIKVGNQNFCWMLFKCQDKNCKSLMWIKISSNIKIWLLSKIIFFCTWCRNYQFLLSYIRSFTLWSHFPYLKKNWRTILLNKISSSFTLLAANYTFHCRLSNVVKYNFFPIVAWFYKIGNVIKTRIFMELFLMLKRVPVPYSELKCIISRQ